MMKNLSLVNGPKRLLRAAGLWLAALTATTTIAVTVLPSEAKACRDCPFPFIIGENRWLMPNGMIEIELVERLVTRDQVAVSLVLRDGDTGELLARGCTQRPLAKNNFYLNLRDVWGYPIRAQINWVDRENMVIQAKFTCMDRRCSIEDRLD